MTMVSPERFAPEGRDVLARLRHVFKVYRIGDTGVVALGGVDLDVPRGEFLAVVGPSGAGKSTILNLLGGLDRASAGVVDVDGQDLGLLSDDALTTYRAERVGFVWQGTARNLVPYLSVRENVRLPGVLHAGLASDRRRERRRAPRRWWTWPTARTTRSGSSPAANSSAPRSRWRCRTPRCCCWPTSPPRSWTPCPPIACWSRSAP